MAYLTSLPDLRRKIPVGPADTVEWSVRGDRLFLRTGALIRSLAVVDDDEGSLAFRRDEELATVDGLRSVRRDPLGRGLLVLRDLAGTGIVTELEMVRGWFTEVQQTLAGADE